MPALPARQTLLALLQRQRQALPQDVRYQLAKREYQALESMWRLMTPGTPAHMAAGQRLIFLWRNFGGFSY